MLQKREEEEARLQQERELAVLELKQLAALSTVPVVVPPMLSSVPEPTANKADSTVSDSSLTSTSTPSTPKQPADALSAYLSLMATAKRQPTPEPARALTPSSSSSRDLTSEPRRPSNRGVTAEPVATSPELSFGGQSSIADNSCASSASSVRW